MSQFEVLIATIDQKDLSFFAKLNIKANAVVANQANGYSHHSLLIDGHQVSMFTTGTRGVGKNRNFALQLAEAEICLLGDDDVTYNDGCAQEILDAFGANPNADAIIFNIHTRGIKQDRRINKTIKRVHWFDFMNYGAVRIAFRLTKIKKANISFSTCFGGGTEISAGEDVLFIKSMLDNGLKVYTHPYFVGTVDQSSSTWFTGYNKKYFRDKGMLLSAAFGRISSRLLAVYFAFRFRNYGSLGFLKNIVLIHDGIRNWERN